MIAQLIAPLRASPARATRLSQVALQIRSAYGDWMVDRDVAAITAALSRLSERRLNLIGLSRKTLVDDLDRLMDRAQSESDLTDEILRLVDESDSDASRETRRIASDRPAGLLDAA